MVVCADIAVFASLEAQHAAAKYPKLDFGGTYF